MSYRLTPRGPASGFLIALISTLSGCSDLSNISDAVVAEIAANTRPSTESFDEPAGAAKSTPSDSQTALAPTEASPEAGTSEASIPAANVPESGAPEIGAPAAQATLHEETQAASQDTALSHETHPRVPPSLLDAIDEQPTEPAPEIPASPTASEEQQADPAPAARTLSAADQEAVAVTIQLAAVASEDLARELWARYQRSFPDLLGDRQLALQFENLGARGTFFRVRTTRYADRARAESVCAQLRARGLDCDVYVETPREEQDREPVLSGEERRKLFEEFFRARQES